MRKIDEMHRRFGVLSDKKCEDCFNLIKGQYNTKYLRKCTVYGATHSEASDWRKKYIACGMFNREWRGNPIIRCISPDSTLEYVPEINGQECMFNVEE